MKKLRMYLAVVAALAFSLTVFLPAAALAAPAEDAPRLTWTFDAEYGEVAEGGSITLTASVVSPEEGAVADNCEWFVKDVGDNPASEDDPDADADVQWTAVGEGTAAPALVVTGLQETGDVPVSIWLKAEVGGETVTTEVFPLFVIPSGASHLVWTETPASQDLAVGDSVTLVAGMSESDEVIDNCEWVVTVGGDFGSNEPAGDKVSYTTSGEGTASPSITLTGLEDMGDEPVNITLYGAVDGGLQATETYSVFFTREAEAEEFGWDLPEADGVQVKNGSVPVGRTFILAATVPGDALAEDCEWFVTGPGDGPLDENAEPATAVSWETFGDGTNQPTIILTGVEETGDLAVAVWLRATVNGEPQTLDFYLTVVPESAPYLGWTDITPEETAIYVGETITLTAGVIGSEDTPVEHGQWAVTIGGDESSSEAPDGEVSAETAGEGTSSPSVTLSALGTTGDVEVGVRLTAIVDGLVQSTEVYSFAIDEPSAVVPAPESPISIDHDLVTGLTATREGTTVEGFLNLLDASIPEGAHLTVTEVMFGDALPADHIVATGLNLELIAQDGETDEAMQIVVSGDVLGTGVLNISQLVRMAKAVNGSELLSGLYLIAGDLTGDGAVNIADLVQEARLMTAE